MQRKNLEADKQVEEPPDLRTSSSFKNNSCPSNEQLKGLNSLHHWTFTNTCLCLWCGLLCLPHIRLLMRVLRMSFLKGCCWRSIDWGRVSVIWRAFVELWGSFNVRIRVTLWEAEIHLFEGPFFLGGTDSRLHFGMDSFVQRILQHLWRSTTRQQHFWEHPDLQDVADVFNLLLLPFFTQASKHFPSWCFKWFSQEPLMVRINLLTKKDKSRNVPHLKWVYGGWVTPTGLQAPPTSPVTSALAAGPPSVQRS